MPSEQSNFLLSESSASWEIFRNKSDGERRSWLIICRTREERELRHGTRRESVRLTQSERHWIWRKSIRWRLNWQSTAIDLYLNKIDYSYYWGLIVIYSDMILNSNMIINNWWPANNQKRMNLKMSKEGIMFIWLLVALTVDVRNLILSLRCSMSIARVWVTAVIILNQMLLMILWFNLNLLLTRTGAKLAVISIESKSSDIYWHHHQPTA